MYLPAIEDTRQGRLQSRRIQRQLIKSIHAGWQDSCRVVQVDLCVFAAQIAHQIQCCLGLLLVIFILRTNGKILLVSKFSGLEYSKCAGIF